MKQGQYSRFACRKPGLAEEDAGMKPLSEVITIEAGKCGGQPCIRGMRITVYDVLSYLAAGMTPHEVLADFPYLEEDDIRACLQYAAERERQTLLVHS